MDIASIAASTQSTASTSAFSSLTQNFDTFLKLLTAQLRNQDPLDPLDTEKFTEQLVQFASVEQSIKTNTHLEALIALQAASERDSALGFVGRTITLASDRAMNSGDGAAWTYSLPGGGASTTLSVVAANGAIVARWAGPAGAGVHSAQWDGRTSAGDKAPAGVYRLVVDTRDPAGTPIVAQTETDLRISAVAFGAGAPVLETEIGRVALDAVRRVSADD